MPVKSLSLLALFLRCLQPEILPNLKVSSEISTLPDVLHGPCRIIIIHLVTFRNLSFKGYSDYLDSKSIYETGVINDQKPIILVR